MTATIYYLQWDQGNDEAVDKYKSIRTDPNVTESEFGDLWEKVGEDPEATKMSVFSRWNRGSGNEADVFLDKEIRSLSVGDIVEIDGTKHLCSSIGWEELEI